MDASDKQQILRAIEQTAMGALTFAEASFSDRAENYPPEVLSPYLPYSLFQSGLVFHRRWRGSGLSVWRQRFDYTRSIIEEFTKRWQVACR
jgi:hypothetical protein